MFRRSRVAFALAPTLPDRQQDPTSITLLDVTVPIALAIIINVSDDVLSTLLEKELAHRPQHLATERLNEALATALTFGREED